MAFAKIIEMSAESGNSFDDVVRQGAEKASKTLENVQSMWGQRSECFRVERKGASLPRPPEGDIPGELELCLHTAGTGRCPAGSRRSWHSDCSSVSCRMSVI